MGVDENVALMKRWFDDVWNQGRMATVHELLAHDAVGFGQAEHGMEIRGPAEYERFAERLRGAFPDIKVKVEDAFGSGDGVVVRWSAVMTHLGGHLGVAATNREVRVTGMAIVRIVNGKIVEGWDNWDQLALMRQIGVITEDGQAQVKLSAKPAARASSGESVGLN